jgi:hypothetical protein
MGLLLFVIPQKLPEFIQAFMGSGMGIIVWSTGPQTFFVKLNPLRLYTPENHGPQAAVSHRESLGPFFGRLLIPEPQIALPFGL